MMKKMSKVVCAILLFAMTLNFVACNSSEQAGETDSSLAEEPTEEVTEKATKKPYKDKSTEPPTKLENTEGLDLNIKVLSQNVRCADDDGGNTVAQRTTRLKGLIEDYKPDLIGTQETTFEWFKYLRTLEGYAIVGSSRDGHKSMKGEWSAIMYKTERFVLMDSDTFWLTETPDKVSITKDAKCRRICTWAELFDRYTGETVIMANTHLDHSTDDVRLVQVSYLVRHLKNRLGDRYNDCTVYLTGDFNCKPETTPYNAIVNGGFTDSRRAALMDISIVNGSYHAYVGKDREIDFCFFKGDETAIEYEIISKNYISEGETEPGFVSDHYGVIVTFKKEG
jgi:endonuclease/exonuclease/phosphatase family metal-dependent hydrolase